MIDEKQAINMRSAIIITIIFIAASILIAIVANIFQIVNHVSIEQALSSDVDDSLFNVVATRMQTSDISIHKITTHDNWHAVAVSSLSPVDYSGTNLVVLLHNNEGYGIVFIGSDYNQATLEAKGVPKDMIKSILSSNLASSYANVLTDSQYNPTSKYPLLQHLPYHTDNLNMTYFFDDIKDSDGTSIPIIKINAQNATERKNAIRKIRLLGYDPGDYRYHFFKFKNQFGKDSVIIKTPIEYHNGGQTK